MDQKNNSADVTLAYSRILGFYITRKNAKDYISNHICPNSLLAINDFFTDLKAETMAVKLPFDQLREITHPFITAVRIQGTRYFSVVKNTNAQTIIYFDPLKNRYKEVSNDFFKEIYDENILLVESNNVLKEENFEINKSDEKKKRIQNLLFIASYVTLFSLILIGLFFKNSSVEHTVFIRLLGALVGIWITTLLVLYELNHSMPNIQKICSFGQKSSCQIVTSSKGSLFFGFSWSSIGFSYFLAFFVTAIWVISSSSRDITVLDSWSFLAAVYIFYSIYYQWKILNKWCTLCIIIQITLLAQAIWVLFEHQYNIYAIVSNTFSFESLIFLFILFTCLIITHGYIQQDKTNRNISNQFNELNKIKSSIDIFNLLLSQQISLKGNIESMGILFGNPNAKYQIVKVCNPYCEPCSDAHFTFERILEEVDDVSLRIIFAASNNEHDYRMPIVKHFLALDKSREKKETKKALHFWYSSEKKVLSDFVSRHPASYEESYLQAEIDSMNRWYKLNEIPGTPTIFVNNFKLPNEYNLNDLRFLLRADINT